MNVTNDTIVADLAIGDWMKQFETVPGGFAVPHTELQGVVGLFCALHDGVVVYVGRAAEVKNRGLYKRLYDFCREGESGRKHYAGRMIHENRRTLELRVLVTGDDRKAAGLAKLLRGPVIALHRPVWNRRPPKLMPPKLRVIAATSVAPPAINAKAA